MTDSNLFQERLLKEIQRLGKSVNQVERELGYSRNALNNYKSRREPSGLRLIELAQYFGISPDYLIGKSNDNPNASPRDYFNRLNGAQKLELLGIVQAWSLEQFSQVKQSIEMTKARSKEVSSDVSADAGIQDNK